MTSCSPAKAQSGQPATRHAERAGKLAEVPSWIRGLNEKAIVKAFGQTISRVIRKFEYEKKGLLVDYIGIENRWHPFRVHGFLNIDHPVVSLRSTTGYWL